jgi:phosphatidylserine decarboxylase
MSDDLRLSDRSFAAVQRVLPTRFLSWLMFKLTRIRAPWFKNPFIRVFMRGFDIRLDEAVGGHPEDYEHFNAFFTRALKPGMRPLDADAQALLCPVDGTVSQLGDIESNTIFQAKHHRYRVDELLGGDAQLAQSFSGGRFCTIYLAPYNYHRIHMPVGARLREWIYVPGRLFSVNPATARAMPRLFARNERVVAIFDSDCGPLAMVLVGALFVGSMETVWAGLITPPHRRSGIDRYTPGGPLHLARGEEMGRFNMGSTVILLAGPKAVEWSERFGPTSRVRMGESIGQWTRGS